MNTNNILYELFQNKLYIEGGLYKAFKRREQFCEFSICIKILYVLLEKMIVSIEIANLDDHLEIMSFYKKNFLMINQLSFYNNSS